MERVLTLNNSYTEFTPQSVIFTNRINGLRAHWGDEAVFGAFNAVYSGHSDNSFHFLLAVNVLHILEYFGPEFVKKELDSLYKVAV